MVFRELALKLSRAVKTSLGVRFGMTRGVYFFGLYICVRILLTEIGFCGNSLGLVMGEMCWDGIEQRGDMARD